MRNVQKIPRPLRRVFKRVSSRQLRSQLHDLDYQLGQVLDTYHHHIDFGASLGTNRLRTFARTTRRLVGRPRILCYPELPGPGSVFYKLCLHQGYAVTNDPSASVDAAIKWRDATYTPTDETLHTLATQLPVLNLRLTDISKGHVGAVFSDVFGYDLAVDPETYVGPILRKSEENAAHDGVVMEGPLREPASDAYVYQRLINNVHDGQTTDLRVPIFGTRIPFVRVKYRPVDKRFDHAGQSQVGDEVRSAEDVFRKEEQEHILALCQAMGLDYGELDVLRDRETDRIYVVDVNSTPTGPTFVSATAETTKWCFDEMADALHTCLFREK